MSRKKIRIVMVLVCAVCLAIGIIGTSKSLDIMQEYEVSKKEYRELQQSIDPILSAEESNVATIDNTFMTQDNGLKNPIDFNKLRSVNPDLRAWLVMPGLGISYPVVQGEDNDEYLHSTFYKTYNFAGCIFIDAACKDGLNGYNCILYGHNMKNGTMFGKLKNYSDESFCRENQDFYICMSNQIRKYRVFNVAYVNQVDQAYDVPLTQEANKEYLESMVERGLFNLGVPVTEKDRTITLSTCTTEASTRLIVQAKIVAVRNFDD